MKITEYSRDDVEGAVDDAKQQGKRLIPWLEDPHKCQHCGSYCDGDVQFVEAQAVPTKVWQCPNEDCGKRYYRDRE